MKLNFKSIGYGLAGVFLLLQFVRPTRNLSGENSFDISKKYQIPADVEQTLKVACYDCHSNTTRYPWYTNIQPGGLWMQNHVNEGKRELNFSEFTKRKVAIQNHKFEEIAEIVEEGEMPLSSYTWIHTDARLTEAQKKGITEWAKAQMDTLRSQYPADSLVLKRKK